MCKEITVVVITLNPKVWKFYSQTFPTHVCKEIAVVVLVAACLNVGQVDALVGDLHNVQIKILKTFSKRNGSLPWWAFCFLLYRIEYCIQFSSSFSVLANIL